MPFCGYSLPPKCAPVLFGVGPTVLSLAAPYRACIRSRSCRIASVHRFYLCCALSGLRFAAISSLPAGPPTPLLSQYFPGDHEALDFAGTFTDRAQFNVPVEFFGGIVFDKAVAAMDLDAFVGDADSHLPSIEFRH